MSVEAVRAAIEHSTAHPTARHVLLILAEAANREQGHEVWLAVDTIHSRTGLACSTVREALRRLEAGGEIGRIGSGRGGRGRSTRYRILVVNTPAPGAFDDPETHRLPSERHRLTPEKAPGAGGDPLRTERNLERNNPPNPPEGGEAIQLPDRPEKGRERDHAEYRDKLAAVVESVRAEHFPDVAAQHVNTALGMQRLSRAPITVESLRPRLARWRKSAEGKPS